MLSSGLFSGDTILEVNGERVQYALVEKVVEAITRVPYHPQYIWYVHTSNIVCTKLFANTQYTCSRSMCKNITG